VLTADLFLPPADEPGLGQLEAALARAGEARAVERRLRDAVREGRLDHAPGLALAQRAHESGLIGDDDLALLTRADEAREAAIAVDDFEPHRTADGGFS
jgi:acyl-CoA dehydrogenase